jgi:PIN domain.
MQIVDANTEVLSEKAAQILENNEVFVPNEVIAEIVYVLEKVYKIKNDEISNTLKELFEYGNLEVDDIDILKEALNLYSKRKLDFVDTLLYAYHKVKNYEVYTFDEKLNKLLHE